MRNKRFLVVDDERSVVDFVRTVIELEGGSVVRAATAAGAIECLRSNGPFDLMVLDIALPDRSGWEVLASAKHLLNGCKVVIFSAQGTDNDAERARDAGVALSLAKPVSATALREALRGVLQPLPER